MSPWNVQCTYWETVVPSGSPMPCHLVLIKNLEPMGTHVALYWPWKLSEYRKPMIESFGLCLSSWCPSQRCRISLGGHNRILRRIDGRELLWSLWDVSECNHQVSRAHTRAIQLASIRVSDVLRPPAWSLYISRSFSISHNSYPLVKKVSTHPSIEAIEPSLIKLFQCAWGRGRESYSRVYFAKECQYGLLCYNEMLPLSVAE